MSAFVPLNDLITPLTVAEVRASVYAVLASIGVTSTNWKPGAVVRTIITALAIVIAGLSALVSLIARSGFLDTATGSWLTALARTTYGVERLQATFAVGTIILANSGGGVFDLEAGDLVVSRTDPNSGITYTYLNTSHVVIGALATGVRCDFAATEPGAAASALPGEINTMVSVLLGVSCTNPAALRGADDESDPDLRTRCRERIGALSPNGHRDAYAFAAKSATRSNGTPIGANRVRVVRDLKGGVDVYAATAGGSVPGTVGDLSTDLGRVDSAIQAQVPNGATVRTHSAREVPIPVTYTLWVYSDSGETEAQLKEDVALALAANIAGSPVGGAVVGVDQGKVFKVALAATILRAATNGPGIKAAVSVPAGDVPLNAFDVPVLGTVTGTIVVVPAVT